MRKNTTPTAQTIYRNSFPLLMYGSDANVYARSRTPTVDLEEVVELGPTLRKKRRAKHFQ